MEDTRFVQKDSAKQAHIFLLFPLSYSPHNTNPHPPPPLPSPFLFTTQPCLLFTSPHLAHCFIAGRNFIRKMTAKQVLIISGFFKNTSLKQRMKPKRTVNVYLVGISSKKIMLGYKQEKFQTERQQDVVCTHIPSYIFVQDLVSCLQDLVSCFTSLNLVSLSHHLIYSLYTPRKCFT